MCQVLYFSGLVDCKTKLGNIYCKCNCLALKVISKIKAQQMIKSAGPWFFDLIYFSSIASRHVLFITTGGCVGINPSTESCLIYDSLFILSFSVRDPAQEQSNADDSIVATVSIITFLCFLFCISPRFTNYHWRVRRFIILRNI